MNNFPESYYDDDPGIIPGYEPDRLKVTNTTIFAVIMLNPGMQENLEAGLIEMCSQKTGVPVERIREIIEEERKRRAGQ